MNHLDLLINALTTILVTIDPPGLAPIFLSLTVGMGRHDRYLVAQAEALGEAPASEPIAEGAIEPGTDEDDDEAEPAEEALAGVA